MKKAVIVSCFGWYERRLYYLYKRLIDLDYDVKMYVSDFQHINKSGNVYKNDKLILVNVPEYTSNISIKRIYSHYCFAKKCYKILLKDNPDFIYVLVPPNFCSWVVYKYKKLYPNTIIFTDIIDLWPESFPLKFIKKIPLFYAWRRMRDDCLELSDCIILECEYYRGEINKRYIEKCEVVRLFKNISSDYSTAVKNGLKKYNSELKSKKIRLCYLGSINNIIDLQSIEEILKELMLQGYNIELHIIGNGSSKQKLIEICQGMKVKLYDYGEEFDENKKVKILTKCDFGINLMIKSVKVGLTIKSIDYLSCGLPLINTIKGDTWSLVKDKNIGINYENDSEKLIQYIEEKDINKLKKNAMKCFDEYFTKEAFEDNFEMVLRKLK